MVFPHLILRQAFALLILLAGSATATAANRCSDVLTITPLSGTISFAPKTRSLSEREFATLEKSILALGEGRKIFAFTNASSHQTSTAKEVKNLLRYSGPSQFLRWILWSRGTTHELNTYNQLFLRASPAQRQNLLNVVNAINPYKENFSKETQDFLQSFVDIAKLHLYDRITWTTLLKDLSRFYLHAGNFVSLEAKTLKQQEPVFIYGLARATMEMPEILRQELKDIFPGLYFEATKSPKGIGARWLEMFGRISFRTEDELLSRLQHGESPIDAYAAWFRERSSLLPIQAEMTVGPEVRLGFQEMFRLVEFFHSMTKRALTENDLKAVLVGSVPNGRGTVFSDLDMRWIRRKSTPDFWKTDLPKIESALKKYFTDQFESRVSHVREEKVLEEVKEEYLQAGFFKMTGPVSLHVTADGIFLQVHQIEKSTYEWNSKKGQADHELKFRDSELFRLR